MWRIDHRTGAVAPGWSTCRIALLIASMALATVGSWLVADARSGSACCPSEPILELYELHEVELVEAGVPDQNPAR